MKNIRFFYLLILGCIVLLGTHSCGSSSGPQPINFGKDQCAHCRMSVSDPRFACQLVTSKGRAFHFDDVQCIIAHVKNGDIAAEDVANYYLPDYSNDNKLLPAEELYLLKSESLKSPMRGDVAAFASEVDLETVRELHGGETLSWKDLWK